MILELKARKMNKIRLKYAKHERNETKLRTEFKLNNSDKSESARRNDETNT